MEDQIGADYANEFIHQPGQCCIQVIEPNYFCSGPGAKKWLITPQPIPCLSQNCHMTNANWTP